MNWTYQDVQDLDADVYTVLVEELTKQAESEDAE